MESKARAKCPKYAHAMRALREAKSLKLKEVAARLHQQIGRYIDPNSLSRIERGLRCPERDDTLDIIIFGYQEYAEERINKILLTRDWDGISEEEKSNRIPAKTPSVEAAIPVVMPPTRG